MVLKLKQPAYGFYEPTFENDVKFMCQDLGEVSLRMM